MKCRSRGWCGSWDEVRSFVKDEVGLYVVRKEMVVFGKEEEVIS